MQTDNNVYSFYEHELHITGTKVQLLEFANKVISGDFTEYFEELANKILFEFDDDYKKELFGYGTTR